MKVRDCVSLTMKVLGYILDNAPDEYSINLRQINNSKSFNRCYLGLDETGFYIEEEKQFNGVFACFDEDCTEDIDSRRISISPYYVVRLLFEQESIFKVKDMEREVKGEDTPKTDYSMQYGISWIMRNLEISEYKLNGCLVSYTKIANLISEIREGQTRGETYPISYIHLKNELSKIKPKNINGIAAKTKSMLQMHYNDIAYLALRKSELARTIALMAQIEEHLIEAASLITIDRAVEVNNKDTSIIDEISLDTEKILDTNVRSWDEFCTALYISNTEKIETQNSIWKRGMERDKLTTFGLDIVPVPGTPKEYVINR